MRPITARVLLVLFFTSACGGAPEVPAADPPAEPVANPDALGRWIPPAPEGTAVAPFTIHVPDAVLDDLRHRLALARWPDEIDQSGWKYGADLGYMKELVAYWQDQYDWREQERRLNQFDHFRTTIDGVGLHFIHQRSKHPEATPLLITHGWPGSVVEFMKIIEPLTDPVSHGGRAEDAFHVVAASIPGFGFSDQPNEAGYGPDRVADMLVTLMDRLGYTRYVAQGGDWGAIIGTRIALKAPERLIGLHLNFCPAGPLPAGTESAAAPSEAELERMRASQAAFADESGYSAQQGTRPQTLGYGLNDSPVGQAAWIVEKFHAWTDNDGSPEDAVTRDELLTNVMVYWVTQTSTSSARLYYESRHADGGLVGGGRVTVPTACAMFPKEVVYTPRALLEPRFNLVRYTEMAKGGHFAAMEEPELLVEDIRAFAEGLR
jgi:pimeloyl-ACP methyl ester carboxylesterase